MDLQDYEQRIGKSRHIEVKIKCEYCGKDTWVKWIRVKVGLGRFCSRECFGKSEILGKDKKYVGKENAKAVLDKDQQRWIVYWFDHDTLKRKSTTYAKWWWEINKGEIPDGYRASYRDGNKLNIDSNNIILISSKEFGLSITKRQLGKHPSEETRKKMSESGKKKKLSEDHRDKISSSLHDSWERGEFESIHVGNHHRLWKGGVKPYPREYSSRLRYKIKHRDGFLCQSCGINVYGSRSGHIHHIDGNKQNCSLNNLVLLCSTCHNAIHGRSNLTNDKIEFYKSKLVVAEHE